MIALQLFRLSYIVLPESTLIYSNPLHPLKAQLPIFITLLGSVISVNPLHPSKADSPILATPSGIISSVKLLHLQKAPFPILVTLFGIVVFLHPAIISFVDVFMIALQLFRLSYTVLPESTLIYSNPLHP